MLPGGIQRHGDQLARHPRADGRAAGRDSGRDRAPTPWSRPASSAPSGRGCGGWRSCRPALRGTGGCGGARAPDHLVLEAPRGPTSKPVAWWLTLQGRQSACEIRFELAHMVVEGELARLGHQVSEATVRRILRARRPHPRLGGLLPDSGVVQAVQQPGPLRCGPAARSTRTLCVPKTSSKSCDQAIFVDQATDASVSSDAVLVEIDRFGQRRQRRGAVQRAVRPVLVMVDLVLVHDPPQMVLVPD
jgi:hypothetical protein